MVTTPGVFLWRPLPDETRPYRVQMDVPDPGRPGTLGRIPQVPRVCNFTPSGEGP